MAGKKAKQGKARKDKFYFLSKQTGFRSRAAFKLIQINRKFNFLKSCRALIDLCAAPGSWLQVAQQEMPVSSIIMGFDLVPIQPIPNVKTFQEDITSDKCRQIIKKELQTWKADCVLHDGAPNVGKAWLHDEYQQAELSLHSFGLATQFLRRGGVFVTKVFRSRDYEPLKWVLDQFFHQVKAVKPEASRLESAEIYLVCLRYKEPSNIDPRFLNPKYVFKDAVKEESKIKHLAQIPVSGKRKAIGYEEEDWKYHKVSVSEFMKSEDFLLLLSKANEISIDVEDVVNHPATTIEVKECCSDIKACGRAELRTIVNWRKRIVKDLVKNKNGEENVSEMDKKTDSQLVEEEINRLHKEEKKEVKKKLRKIREEKKKLHERMQLKMHHPDDQIEQIDDVELFSLSRMRRYVADDSPTVDEIPLDSLDPFMNDKEESATQPTSKKSRHVTFLKDAEMGVADVEEEKSNAPLNSDDSDDYSFNFDEDAEDDGDDENYSEDDAASCENDIEEEERNPLLVDWQSSDERKNCRVESWYDKDIFKDSDDEEYETDSNNDEEGVYEVSKSHSGTVEVRGKTPDFKSTIKKTEHVQPSSTAMDSGSYRTTEEKTSCVRSNLPKPERRRNEKEEKRRMKIQKLSPEELTIGEMMANSLRQRREIEEESYHRFMGFGDGSDNLPAWFVEDERRHMRKPLPVTRHRVIEYRNRQQAVDSHTIGKVAEARARKRMKAQKRLEKVRKKADTITNEEGMPETEKWGKIKQLYKKAGFLGHKKRSVKYVVSSRSGSRPNRSSSNGKKGQVSVTKVVDKRLKADKRGMNASKRKGMKGCRNKRR